MKLSLFHGRYDPNQEMDNWGFVGPVLEDVLYMHVTYQCDYSIGFLNLEAAIAAEKVTGWERWGNDEPVLTMKFHEDMVVAKDTDGRLAYYGDWEVMLWAPADKP